MRLRIGMTRLAAIPHETYQKDRQGNRSPLSASLPVDRVEEQDSDLSAAGSGALATTPVAVKNVAPSTAIPHCDIALPPPRASSSWACAQPSVPHEVVTPERPGTEQAQKGTCACRFSEPRDPRRPEFFKAIPLPRDLPSP